MGFQDVNDAAAKFAGIYTNGTVKGSVWKEFIGNYFI